MRMRVRRFGSCSARWAMSQRRSFDSRPATPTEGGRAGGDDGDGAGALDARGRDPTAVWGDATAAPAWSIRLVRARGRLAPLAHPLALRVVGRVHGALADPVEELVGVPSPTLRHRRAGPRVGHRHSGRHVHVVSGQRHRGRRVVARRLAATRGFARAVASRRAARPPSRERHDGETRWSRTRPRRDTPSAPRNGASGAPHGGAVAAQLALSDRPSEKNARPLGGPATNGQQHPSPRDGPTLRRTRPGDVVHDEETPWVTPSSTTRATSTSGVVRPRGGRCAPVFRPRVPAAPRIFLPRARARPRGRHPVQTVTSRPSLRPSLPTSPRPQFVENQPHDEEVALASDGDSSMDSAGGQVRAPPAPPARAIRAVNARPFRRISHPIIPPRDPTPPPRSPTPRDTTPPPRSPTPLTGPHPSTLAEFPKSDETRRRRIRRRDDVGDDEWRRRRRVVDGGFEVERRVLRVRSRRTTPRARGNPARARTTPRRTRIST